MNNVEGFASFLRQANQANLDGLLERIVFDEGKKSFLVYKDNKYITIQKYLIAYIYVRHATSTIMTFQGQEYPLVQSLDQLQGLLSGKQFFRLNRQYLINFYAVKEVEHYFARKLLVNLTVPAPDKLLVSKEKVSCFLNWLDDR